MQNDQTHGEIQPPAIVPTIDQTDVGNVGVSVRQKSPLSGMYILSPPVTGYSRLCLSIGLYFSYLIKPVMY